VEHTVSILISKALVGETEQDIYITGGKIQTIGAGSKTDADETIDGRGKAAIPSFMNGHTHAAMVLMRGLADDMLLHEWLEKAVWPFEANLTEEDVYWGTRLACLEMIKTGTTFFNDMYWYYHGVARAVEDAGIRAAVSAVFIDMFDDSKADEQIAMNQDLFEETTRYSNRISFALGPHALYTVSEKSLLWAVEFALEHHIMIHTHLSETQTEAKDCIRRTGKRPVEYLHDIGLLDANVIAAHVIWVDDREIELLRQHDVTVVYNPTSNMKLSAGIFPYSKLKKAGLRIVLGTDGCASNNNLDMLEEMKFATLLQKMNEGNPSVLPAEEVFDLATVSPAHTLNSDPGVLKPGQSADLLLVNLQDIHLNPRHHLIADLVYSAQGSCIDTTICDGKILMRNGVVEGEEEVLQQARSVAEKLAHR
jgi:5-methylthioadenosine/S-adenosylhomocysteine deaminase